MTSMQSLELFILDGEQAGARAPLQSGTSIDVSGDLDTDIVLRDPQMVGQHIRLGIGTEFAQLDVLAGDAELSGQRIGAGGSAKLPPYVPLKIGSTTLAYGETDSERWADILQPGVDPMHEKSARLNMHAEPSTHYRQSHKSSPNATRGGLMLWLSAVIVAVFGLTLGLGAFSSINTPNTAQQLGSMPDVATVLKESEFNELEVTEREVGEFTVRGYLETREQRARLVRLLAESAVSAQVQMQVLVGEQLAAAVRDVYRVNGIAADVQPRGPGIVHVKTAVANLQQLHRVETIARRDIASLLDVVVENDLPPVSAAPARTLDDPDKRIASIVPGDPAYLVTTDGARYFVGAMLPTGHKISAISDQQVLLDKGGVMTTLRF